MKRPSALLFDMDGVLVRSEEVWFRLVEESGTRFRGRPVTREEFAPTFGQGTKADVAVFGLSCTPDELDAFYLHNFARYADHTWVDPTARGVLERLRAKGIRTSVVTNTMTPLAKQILEAAHLFDLFDAVACADQVPRAKPAPDIVHHALRLLDAGTEDAWMIGDSRYDREAARGAGVSFVGYRLDGDTRVESLPALTELVGD